jgi:hypothetical protein
VRLRGIGGADDGHPRRALDLRGPTDCSLISPAGRQAAIIDQLGRHPLRADASPLRFESRVARTATSMLRKGVRHRRIITRDPAEIEVPGSRAELA